MARFLFIITSILLTLPAYTQEYFNKRFDFDQPGIWDGATTVILLPDGYVIGGGTGTPGDEFRHRIGIIKLAFNGNSLLSKIYGDSISEYYLGNPGCIVQSNDTSFIAVGSKNTYLSDSVHQVGLLLFLNSLFDTIFCKKFGDKISPNDTDYQFEQIKVYGSNFIIVGGKKPYGLATKAILIKTNNQGSLIWERSYGYSSYYQGHSVICTNDGGYAIGGFTWFPIPPPNDTGDAVLVKTDSAGNQKWLKLLGGPYYDTQGMICNTLDGNMVLGYCYCDWMDGDNSYRRINLIKLDNAGNVIWDKKYGAIEPENTLLNIGENTDGSLIFTGTVIKEFQTNYKYMGWIMKTTDNGDSLWYRQYDICEGEGSWHYLYDVIQTADNGYLACGVVYPMPPDTGSQDGWVIKVDSLGCEAPGECWVGIKPENKLISNGFDIYPNPAERQTDIKLRITNCELRIRIRLFDLIGREVRNIIVPPWQTEYQLDVSGLPAGLYTTVVESGDRIIGREKLVVQ